jgi:Phage tail tube, TTP, lambda-like
MTVGTVPTQGTKLYFIDTVSQTDPTIVKMACPTGITGVGGGAKDQIETTCLDTLTDKTYNAGLGNPAAISVPFNLIPRETSHQLLFELKRLGTVLNWMEVLSDNEDDPGNAAFTPAIDTDDVFEVPTDRSSFTFSAYVSEVNIDAATNEIVRGTLTLQRSGVESFFGYEPA